MACTHPRHACTRPAPRLMSHGPRRSGARRGYVQTRCSTVEVSLPSESGSVLRAALTLTSPGTQLTTATLKKPLGIIFAVKQGRVTVDELTPGGHAEKSGAVQVGDVLRATTARLQATSNSAGEQVLFVADGEKFDSVIAAIQSNTCAQCNVFLVLERATKQA